MKAIIEGYIDKIQRWTAALSKKWSQSCTIQPPKVDDTSDHSNIFVPVSKNSSLAAANA